MQIDSVILGRPWMYDVDLTSYGHSNQCCFIHKGKRIQLYPTPPKPVRDIRVSLSTETPMKDPHILCYDTLVPQPTIAPSSSFNPTITTRPATSLNLITFSEFKRDIIEGASVWIVVVNMVSKETSKRSSHKVKSL